MQLSDSPPGMLREHWVGILSQLLQHGQETPLSAVAHGDHRVSPQPRKLCPFYRRAPEGLLELLAIHLRQPLERGIHQPRSRLEFGRGACRRPAIPRTDVLADV